MQLGGCKWLLNTIEGKEFYFIHIYSVCNDYLCSSSASSFSSTQSIPLCNSNISLIKFNFFFSSETFLAKAIFLIFAEMLSITKSLKNRDSNYIMLVSKMKSNSITVN